MPRKGENIYRRKDGRWEGRYVKERSKEGKVLYGYVYGKTYNEAKMKRLDRIAALANETNISSFENPADKEVYFSSLSQAWLELIRPQIKISTYNKYRNLLKSYILPEFGRIKITELTSESLRSGCNYLLEHGGVKKTGLSSKTPEF